MSAILDALKKAQEERKGPTHYAGRSAVVSYPKSRWVIYSVVAGVIVVGACLFLAVGRNNRQSPRIIAPASERKEAAAVDPLSVSGKTAGTETGVSVPGVTPSLAGRMDREVSPERRPPGGNTHPGTSGGRTLMAQAGVYDEGTGSTNPAVPDAPSKYRRASTSVVSGSSEDYTKIQVEKFDETDITTMYNKALKEGEKGDMAEAKRLYLAILAHRPDNVEVLNNLGVMAMKENNGKEALFYFRKILEIKKDYGTAYNNIGFILLKEGDRQLAEWNFRKAIEAGHDSVEPYLNLSALLRSEKRLGEASKLLESLLSRGEKSPAVHLSYAIIKDEMGQPAEAIAYYRHYLREAGSSGETNPVVERLKVLETSAEKAINEGTPPRQ
jgi:Flp pilus assembly protein TadD